MALNIKKHRIIMINILKDIVGSVYWKHLGFKWGTLLYLLYNLDRFSTDLDFDLLDKWSINEEKMLVDLAKICSKHGKVKDMYNKEKTLFLLVDYEPYEMKIKIEINKKRSIHSKYEYKSILWYQVLCMEAESLFANKLVALTQRKNIASRDLFDVHFFLKKWFEINENIIKERTGKSLKSYLKYVIDFITKNFTEKTLLAGLGELVDQKQKYFIKNLLVQETCEYLKLIISD